MTNKPIKFETDDEYQTLRDALNEVMLPELLSSPKDDKKKPA